MLSDLLYRLRSLFRRDAVESEMDAELRFHFERQVEKYIRSGLAREEATRRARLEFGGYEQLKEECRDARGVRFLETLLQDIRYGLRTLGKSPGFAVIATLTLALGIGANAAIFSVVDAILLKPLPYPEANQLVFVFEDKPEEGIKQAGCYYQEFEEWRRENQVFKELAGIGAHQLTLTGRGDPSLVRTAVVTPEVFSLLEIKPLAGRTFSPEDGKQGAAPVVILNEKLWREQFGANPNIVGTPITLDKRLFTVIGIMPAGFRIPLLPSDQDIWIPLAQDPLFGSFMPRRGLHWLAVIGRLKPNVSMGQAQAEMDAIGASFAQKFPAESAGWVIRLEPLQQEIVGNVKTALSVLLGAVGLVLLIACTNIANLLLSRAAYRAKEISLRFALGASRARIVRQLLTESALLGLLGGVAGLFLAYWGVHALTSFLPPDLPQTNSVSVDGWVLGFALLLSGLASFVFGLAPALFAADCRLQTSLNEQSGRSSPGGGRRLAGSFLAAGEIALAMILLAGGGLLLRSFRMLTAVSPGFDVTHVVKADVSLPQFQYREPRQWSAFTAELLGRIQADPGLRDSAAVVPLPLVQGAVNLSFAIAGNPPARPGTSITADYASVSPGYFRVVGIPLLRGRNFNTQDSESTPRVTIISETLAQHYFPNQDPLGKQLVFAFPPARGVPWEIVGIVSDVRDVALNKEPGPMMYVPFSQAPFWGAAVIVKSTLSPSSIGAAIRQEVWNIDKDLPVTDITPLSAEIDDSVAQPRFRTWLLGLFAAMALLLAAAGIFGVISYSVSSRTREIGIRIALGATPARVLSLILAESVKVICLGLAVGIPSALGLARLLSDLLFGVRPADPLTLAGVTALLTAVALAACYIPARRAMRVDPMVALRYE